MVAPASQQQVLDALEVQIRERLEDERIYQYAESLKVPWKDIYAGNKDSPSYEEIIESPGPWVKTPIPGLFKSFAHKFQRQMTYPFEDLVAFARMVKAIFFCYFAGNQGGKSVWATAWVVMEALGIHPLQHITFTQVHDQIEDREPGFFAKHTEWDFPLSDKTVRPNRPVHWWVVSPDLPAEAKIEQGEDAPVLKSFVEWTPKKELTFYRKDKIAAIRKSILNFKSHDQSKKKIAGDRLDGIFWDEEPPKPFWSEGIPRIMKKHGLFLLAMTSDYGSWTWELEQKKNNPEYVFCNMDSMANPFINKEFRERLYAEMSEDEILMRRFGKHIQMKGKVFPFNRSIHVGKPFEVSNDCSNYIITDWHPVKPVPTTFLSINSQNIWYIWTETLTREHIVDTVAQDIWQKITMKSHNLRVMKWIIDPIAKVPQVQNKIGVKPKDIVTMFREIGIRYMIGNPIFDSAHAFLCRKMNLREFYIDPSCSLHIEQFDTWGAKRYQKGNLEGALRDQLEVEGDDTCINCVYAYNAGAKFSDWVEENRPQEPTRRANTSLIYRGARV